LPDEGPGLRRAEDLADRLRRRVAGKRVLHREAGHLTGVSHPNALRYAAPTGTVLIRWEGARDPVIWTVPAPKVDPRRARLELARRYLHVFGPATPSAFAGWAGITTAAGLAAFDDLAAELTPVRTPIGDASILSRDEPRSRAAAARPADVRLLPSGDTYFLLHGADRTLLLPNAAQRASLWTSRVWPGALLVRGEIVGIWRRAEATVSVTTWRRLSREERGAVEAEAASLPLPGLRGPIRVLWAED
jgi:hypothetical protein